MNFANQLWFECYSHTIGLEEAREMGELHDEQPPHTFQTLLEHVNDILDETMAQVRLLHWQTWKNGLPPQFANQQSRSRTISFNIIIIFAVVAG
jgi:hypothetical protein